MHVANAFETLGVTWFGGSASFRINPNFPQGDFPGSADEWRDLQVATIRCAADTWREQSSTNFRFQYLGRTSRSGFNVSDNTNVVSFVNADGGSALAATLINGTGTRATSFDIVFFGRTNGDPNTWTAGEDPPSGAIDVLGVGVHEFGHALGLAHSPVLEATMYEAARRRGRDARTLHLDDRDGVETLYGTREDADTAVNVLSMTPNFGSVDGGNAVVVGGRNFSWTADTTLWVDGNVVNRSLYDVLECQRIQIHEMPAGVREGPVEVRVRNERGQSTLADGYRYGPPGPEIFSIEPAVGPTSGGVPVTIHGENFELGVRVSVGENLLRESVLLNSSTVVGTLPDATTAGTVSVTLVQGPDRFTLPDAFTYATNILQLGDVSAPAGAQGVVLQVLATHDESLGGASFALVYSGPDLGVDEINVDGTLASAAEFAAANIDNDAGVTTFGLVMSFTDATPSIPPGEDQHIANVVVSLSEDLDEGEELPLTFESGAGSPPIDLQFTLAGGATVVEPAGLSGKVTVTAGALFIRGDTDLSEELDISDAVVLLGSLFQGVEGILCEDAADANDDGGLDISDAVAILQFLFAGAEAPPPPFPKPGADPTGDDLDCEVGV
jgi:hypothetical protein